MRKIHLSGLLVLAILTLALPAGSPAQISVGLSVHIGPPALPVYVQPVCPAPGYIWTPGYWAYGEDGYYWVPGTWVLAPTPGFLWTPGYWGWGGGVYVWHAGYWGPHVGFYGGINYGFGYGGVGFVGGRWDHGVFAYNTAVTNVNTTVIRNTYVNKTVINNVTVNHVSYNGGTGGVTARPTSEERLAERDHHVEATSLQREHEHSASTNRELRASENHGRPSIAATSKPGEFKGHGVVAASAGGDHGGPKGENRPNNAGGNRSNNAADMHKSDRPPSAHGGNGNDNRPQSVSHVDNGKNNSHVNNGNGGGNAPHVNEHANAPRGNNAPRAPQHENAPRPENKPHPEGKPQGGEKPHKG